MFRFLVDGAVDEGFTFHLMLGGDLTRREHWFLPFGCRDLRVCGFEFTDDEFAVSDEGHRVGREAVGGECLVDLVELEVTVVL
jgi:hypothetical protein